MSDLPEAAVRPFPDPATVFAPGQEWLSEHLDPLVSIDLSAIAPELSGWVHLISPREPVDGYVGDDTEIDQWVAPNWLSFRYDEQGRYLFLGPREYFLLERSLEVEEPFDPEGALVWKRRASWRQQMQEHYAAEGKSFAQARQLFAAGQGLPQQDWDTSRRSLEALTQLGGDPSPGNWFGSPEPPQALRLGEVEQGRRAVFIAEEDEGDDGPVARLAMADGAEFLFVGSVPGWHYRNCGADDILLFVEPESRTAVLTFDWT